jgi:hypothetical protein
MSEDQEPQADPELARLLQEWSVPAVPDRLDARVKTLFRARSPRVPLWRRLFTVSIRVPLPVAVAVLLLLLAALWRSNHRSAPDVESAESGAGTRAARNEMPPRAAESLAGFQPVREMNVTVLSESGAP